MFGNTLMAQQDPSATTPNDTQPLLVSEVNHTRALIIGISDYKDSLIGDLHYAHKDAEIFADYLRSEAGGALPEEDIWVMTNKQATLGAIDNALNWLINETKKGDKVIIYFSGHGDVERKTLWQRGYLLTHNTPAHNYRNNAVRVEELDEIIKTLSVGNEAKVIVILDACRSGKLATAGPNLTAEQLEKQVENEVRILSCKSDQKSLESELWGQGRGLFSFFLINGLKGLADKVSNDDRVVTFDELRSFLEANMGNALQHPGMGDRRQNPVFVGDERFELAKVEDQMLAAAAMEMGIASASPSTASSKKGVIEKGPSTNETAELTAFLSNIDLSSTVLLPDFEGILASNDPNAVLRFFTKNISDANWEEDAQAQRLAFASRLHDQAQEVINLYLQGDALTLDQRWYTDQAEKYVQYPRMLQAALVLLPQGHLLRRNVEVKLHYFDGVCTRLASQMSEEPMSRLPEAFAKQKKALALDDKAAYIHNELGLLYLMTNKLDSAKTCFSTAAALAPNWALPHANLCAVLGEQGQLEPAKMHCDTAIHLQPDYFGTYVNLGNLAEKKRDYLQAETLYRKARVLNDPHYLPFERRASVQLETARYEEADWHFHEMELRKQGIVAPLALTVVVASPMTFYDEPFTYPSLSGPGVLEKQPKTAEAAFLSGKFFFEKGQMEQAANYFKQAMRLDPNHREVFYYLGKINFDNGNFEDAEWYFTRLIELRPEVPYMPFFLADVYRQWQRPKEEERIYRRFIHQSQDQRILTKVHLLLAELLEKQGRFSEQELMLWGFYRIDDRWASYELANFYHNMTSQFPNDPDWKYRYADFNYKCSSHLSGVLAFEQLLKMDTAQAARAYIHALAGAYYLNEGGKTKRSETDTTWRGDLPKAIEHLRKAVALEPAQPSAKYDLARACTTVFEYEEALAVLRSLRDSNDLDLDSRLLLADLEMRSGNTDAAAALLEKAWDMLPKPERGLAALAGKLQQLKGNAEAAIQQYETETKLESHETPANLSYSIARLYAQSGKKADSLKWLKTAFDMGFKSKLVVKYDPALDVLRKDAEFEGLLVGYGMK